MPIVYLTLEQAVDIHRKTIAVSGGGSDGHFDLGKLDSVLNHIQNDEYYPTFAEKLTHLFFCANKFHCFKDGNKRIAISLCAQFLLLNGYVFIAGKFIREMENVTYHVAAGKIDKDLLYEIMCAMLEDEEENEELKLKIVRAISE